MSQQSYSNHTRWYPLVHFVIVPLLLALLVFQGVRLYQDPNWDRATFLILVAAVLLVNLAARLQALKAQDRLIRLEERLRYERVLDPALANRAKGLRTGQMIALRFASDEELATLVEKTLAGDFKTNSEIKKSITNWRGDHLRV